MANDTQITVIGRLTSDAELRFTPSGAAVANFTVASNPSHFDKQRNEWVNDPAQFWPCTAWRDLGEHAAILSKGTEVIAVGTIKTDTWKDKTTGEDRSRMGLNLTALGPNLRFQEAQVHKAERPNPGTFGAQPAAPAAPAQDAWGAQPAAPGGWPQQSEPPF